ncbi:IS4 family transposase [Rhizobium beringeri]
MVSLDGSTFDVADDPALEAAFGRPGAGHGESAFPQVRFVSLGENGTHVLFGTKMAGCTTSEIALTKEVLPALRQDMLCLADRNFFGYAMWTQASATGADLLWRIKQNARLKDEQRLPDGSYLSHIYPSETDRRRKTKGVAVRVIDYRLDGVEGGEPIYRLATTVLDHAKAGAEDLAALYHERWEIETALGELKTHLRGAKIVLRSKTPTWCARRSSAC